MIDSTPLLDLVLKVYGLRPNEEEVLFEVTQMYESPCSCDFQTLKKFSELFGTDNIDKYDDIWCSNILNYKWTLLHTTVEEYENFQRKIK